MWYTRSEVILKLRLHLAQTFWEGRLRAASEGGRREETGETATDRKGATGGELLLLETWLDVLGRVSSLGTDCWCAKEGGGEVADMKFEA
jgi:hypothetical protein